MHKMARKDDMNIFSDECIEIIKEAFIMGIDRCNTFIKSGKKMKDCQAYCLFNDRWDHCTKKLITKEISDFGGNVKQNLDGSVNLVLYYGELNQIIEILTQIRMRVQEQIERCAHKHKLTRSFPVRFIHSEASPRRLPKCGRRSAKRLSMLGTPTHESHSSLEVTEEGFKDGCLVINLSDQHFDVYRLASVMIRHKSETLLLLGDRLEQFLNFYRSQRLDFYLARGLNITEFKAQIERVVSESSRGRSIESKPENFVICVAPYRCPGLPKVKGQSRGKLLNEHSIASRSTASYFIFDTLGS